jgi:lipopolysaccharide export LptBFGC system permease protein LptF
MASTKSLMSVIVSAAIVASAVIVGSAMIVAPLAGPAAAQSMNMPINDSKSLTDEEKAKKAEQERAYKAAIGKIPDQKASVDPWGNVRPLPTNQNQRSNSNSK